MKLVKCGFVKVGREENSTQEVTNSSVLYTSSTYHAEEDIRILRLYTPYRPHQMHVQYHLISNNVRRHLGNTPKL